MASMGERNRFRWAWWLLAYAALGLGLVGIFVPGLPTVPFILLSAFAAARGSARLEKQLLDDPRFGPLIRDWQRDGSVPRRAKWLATWAMLASGLLLVALMWLGAAHRAWMLALPIGCMAVVCIWLWLRPEPPVDGQDRR